MKSRPKTGSKVLGIHHAAIPSDVETAFHEMLPVKNDKTIIIRVYYNFAKKFELEKYEESIKYCDQGIKFRLNNEVIYTIGELFYYKGYCLYKLNKNDDAEHWMRKAIQIFELQNNEQFIASVNNKINEINANKINLHQIST
jgi:tetratricopeptide (TPR) repeat protein